MQLADGRSIALPSRVLGELARWIQRVDGDFGLDELHRAGFGPSPPLLAALRRFVEVGVLETCDAHPEDPPFNELMSGAYPFGLS
ncbi:MAG: hypothetical protein FJ170_09360 [Gammaproteobacteria bacterium]|nr:hypothetical protein [Gammaproteobacteria bacterium]